MRGSDSLAAFFPDAPFQPPFGGGEAPEAALASEYRRARPLVLAEDGGQPTAARVFPDAGAASPLRQLLLDPALAPLLRLHPFQPEQTREGEREWLFACRELLRERLAFAALGSPAASLDGVAEQAEALLRVWVREKHGLEVGGLDSEGPLASANGLVFVATGAEIASGAVPPGAVPLRNPLALSPARLYLFTPAAVAEEVSGGPEAVPGLIEAVHRVGSLAGMSPVDIRWIGAGLSPARLGFDLAFFDFGFLMEGEGAWLLPAFERRLVPWLPADADEEWTTRPDLLLRADAGLRLMGESGLAAAAAATAIRADYAGELLRRAGRACGRSLLEIAVPRRGLLRFSGLEEAGEIEQSVEDILDEADKTR